MILCGDWAPQNEVVAIELGNEQNMVFNLEGPVKFPSYGDFKTLKAGPYLINSSLPSISGKATYVLANNHIMDFGVEGLNNSLIEVSKSGATYVGAGLNLKAAQEPLVIVENGLRIGIVACCEHQFGIAGHNTPGAAEIGPWIYASIASLKAEVDFIIISVHSGMELSPLPTPFHRELYKSYIDAGANLIYGHHSHIPQAYEMYKDAYIFYGLGNFAVHRNPWQNLSNALWSIGIQLSVEDDQFDVGIKIFEIDFQGNSETRVKLSKDARREEYMNCLESYKDVLKNETLYEAVNQEICIDAFTQFGAKYLGFSVPVKRKSRRLRTIARQLLRAEEVEKQDLAPKKALLRKVMISCESHRQMVVTALQVLGGEIEDLRTEESRKWIQKFITDN